MARFNVNAPDGSIIPVDAPAGATEQDAIAFAAATWKPTAAPVQATPAPRQPGFLTQFGRNVASLADITVGGVIPAVAQQVVYPLARLGRTDEEAQATTKRVVSAVDQPFGKAFGVSETPEYQQEAGRQLVDFIGQNFQKGAKWIAEKTGLPQSDVESYMGTASIAAPKVAPPVVRAVRDVTAPAIEKAVVGAKMPFEQRRQAKLERLSQEDYARGPQIDAIKEARRLKLVLNPVDIDSSAGPKLLTTAAGNKGVDAVTNANRNQVRNIALGEMDLPLTAQLDSDAAFNQARKQVAGPYEQVKKLPIQQADDAMVQRLEALRADLDVIGAQDYAPAISKIVDDAVTKTQTGLTGEQLLKNISVLRNRAKRTYNNKAATDEALDIADTNLKIATELESMIDGSISNPKLLGEFRDARQKMAKTYAYEGATDFNTGIVDVSKLARITAKNNAMTGDIASIGKIAGNFPEAFSKRAASRWDKALAIGRSGAAGTLGGAVGYAFGQDYISAAAGTVLGALGGKIGESVAARRVASPGYQAGLQLRDMRIPVNQLAASMQPIPQNRAIVPYEAPVEVLGPGEGPYQPNFVMRPNQYDTVVPGTPEAPRNMLGYDPNVPVQGQPGAFNLMRQRERDLSMRQGTAAEQQAAAAEAAARQPTRGGVELVFDTAGNLVEAPTAAGAGGVLPSALESAVAKMSGQVIEQPSTSYKTMTVSPKSGAQPYTRIIKREGETTFERGVGQAFNMTAEEKIAWNKAKADLAEVMPGMKALDDKAIAAKMMDREWIQQAVAKSKEKARMLDDIIARSDNERLRQDAMMKREVLQGNLEMLEEQFRKSRPVKTGGQGPKTRAFQRNMLSPEQEIKNALVK
jgi:hypothetical protein